MSSPGDTDMTTNDSNQLLQSLLQRLEDMSTRMERLEAPSHELPQTPGHNTDATTDPTPTSETSNTSVPITPKPRHSLPHPPTFGGNKSQWRGWKLEMEGKIEEDAQAIGSLKAQLRYVYMRLDGAAKTNVTTYYEIQVKEESPNPFKLLDRLELLYGERNRKEKAIQNLYSIRQKDDETFISFYPRFEKEMANADAESWPEHTKISYLRNALSGRIKDRLVGTSGAETSIYARFAQKCVDLSNDMELFGQWTKTTRRYGSRTAENALTYEPPAKSNNATLTAVSPEDMMEWEPTQPTTTQVNAVGLRGKTNMNGYPSRRPEDRELIGKRAKWVNQEEIDARRQERRCLRCGRNNCRIATCPLAAALRPTHVSVKTAKSTVVTKAAVEEEDPEDSEAEQ
ncbi:Retrotrans-gag domain containing protein [Pyrenophora tritici-repentis]|uniref:Retrotrans-gag domain containing protein n=1 Tax=Pyrenophora tritici-repentis TaxID=45151 RepID=A0A317ADD3_9PLEO|nr:Retrotransposon gag protein [Pyrenophora tritici-repentis]KAF7573377.1 Retrotrans-gag domain containing protein [Pyrenophora tritici-repentis]KAI1510780.1 Retrotransposon gag protein [Pyrenophora tritici-repentis]KAI1510789.1 Retrotransposon gag protein [Pyrenophora tritici-repentis]KAI1516304.1 Retrotransposon gag protein [Pyrenophora tritici-repentis]